jgi:hypothetical protein
MTPKEKAKELVEKFYQEAPLDEIKFYSNDVMAKSCAVICVSEIMKALDEHQWQNRFVIEYYNEVKNEIEKL